MNEETLLEKPLEVPPALAPWAREILYKLGCIVIDKPHHSLIQFPEGTTWKVQYVVSNTHYKIRLPDGNVLGAEYSRWLGLRGQYLLKIAVELAEHYGYSEEC